MYDRLKKLFGEASSNITSEGFDPNGTDYLSPEQLKQYQALQDDQIEDLPPGNTNFLTPEQLRDYQAFQDASVRDKKAQATAAQAKQLLANPPAQSNSFLSPEQRSLIDNTTQARIMTNQADLSSPDDQFATPEELAQIRIAPTAYSHGRSMSPTERQNSVINESGQTIPPFLQSIPQYQKPGMSPRPDSSLNGQINPAGVGGPFGVLSDITQPGQLQAYPTPDIDLDKPTDVPTEVSAISPKPVVTELGQQQPPMPDPQSIGSLENLLAAQNAANNVRSVNQGSQGLDLISAGIAGLGSNSIVKPSGQALFKQQGEAGDKITADYKDAVVMEKHDPNSPVSKAIQKYAKKLGFDPKGLSAADMEKVMPYVSKAFDAQENRKARKDELALRLSEMNQRFALAREQKAADKEEKNKITDLKTAHSRLDKVGNKIIPGLASARSAFGRMAGTIRSAEALKKLVADQPLNSIDSRQVYELARGLDSMLSQSQGTIAGTDHLIPRTLQSDIAKIKEYGSNGPVGLNQQKFVKKTMKLLEREFQLAEEQMKKVQKQQLAPLRDLFEHKSPEIQQAARDIISIHGIDNPFEEKTGLQKDFESEGD